MTKGDRLLVALFIDQARAARDLSEESPNEAGG